MKQILLPTAYLPTVSWMAAAIQTEIAEIEIHETYPKQTIRNHCTIATSTGRLSLTVPVNRTLGNHTKTCEIRIDNSTKWQQLHWRSIVTAYNKSPYFIYYRDVIEPVYHKKVENLTELNSELLRLLLDALSLKEKKIYYTSGYEKNPLIIDLRNSFNAKLDANTNIFTLPRYMQVFESTTGYIPDLSIIDLLFNLGPDSLVYLKTINLNA